MLAAIPVASSAATAAMAAREKRGTTVARTAARRPGSVAAASTSSPARPPIQIDPAARCAQSRNSMSPTGLVVDGWPASPGRASAAAAQPATPSTARIASPERRLRPGTVERQRRPCGDREQREHAPEVAERPAEARVAHERDDRPDVAPGPQGEFRRREHQVDGRRHERERERDGGARRDGAQGALAAARHLQRPGDHGAECEQADRGHHREQQHPPRAHEARRRGALAERRDDELRRGPRARPHREGERTAHRMPVGRDHAPPDEVPALRNAVQRDEDRVSDRRPRAPGCRRSAACPPRR